MSNQSNKVTILVPGPSYEERMKARLENGHAWMLCNECGAKLWDFDGHKDSDRRCPYKDQFGKCNPK